MVKFYHSNTCGKCKVLEIKLKDAGIEYEGITDIEVMKNLGLDHIPWLEVDGKLMNCSESLKWIREQKKKKEVIQN